MTVSKVGTSGSGVRETTLPRSDDPWERLRALLLSLYGQTEVPMTAPRQSRHYCLERCDPLSSSLIIFLSCGLDESCRGRVEELSLDQPDLRCRAYHSI